MHWLILALISIVSISVANIYQRMAMRDEGSDPIAGAIVFQFVLTFIVGGFALLHGFVFPPFREYPLQFLISSVFYALGTLAYFHAARKIEASEMRIVSAIGTLVPVLGAVLLLGESITVRQVVGMFIILLAVIIVQKKRTFSINRGVMLAIAGSAMYGIGLVSDVFVLRTYDAISYLVVMSLFPGLILLLLHPQKIFQVKVLATTSMKHVFLYGFFYSIQAIAYYTALQSGANLSQLAPLFKAEVILTVLLAAVMLKERRQLLLYLLGALLVAVGALLIT